MRAREQAPRLRFPLVIVVRPEATELDMDTAPQLDAQLRSVPHDEHLVIDLSDVTFCDSSGLRVILNAHVRAWGADGQVQVRGASDTVARLFVIVACEHLLEDRHG